ncbi:MAG: putative toxin-antitoxin system toxin component, PIN family [Dysgonamonadaceae bacterium]|jgi:putative PIN family toxin of toxin-antitoxin system|nr:putative toxin-antitoxin system toxin component, PIN family [Dysgonamonadaceae bacterium]
MKVIFDTNVWISFLIGKRLSFIKEYIADARITIIITGQLIEEIKEVTQRKQLRKYFPQENVRELLHLLDTIAEKFEIKPTHFISRDPKDNFLLDLIDASMADYLVTGDKDLLSLNPFKTTKILTPVDFETMINFSD